MTKKNSYAGMHLIIDASFGRAGRKIVSDREMMSEYLDKVTEITGMTLVMPPVALKFPFSSETHRLIRRLKADGVSSPVVNDFMEHIHRRDTEGQGVSALSMWLESHCALHSWTDKSQDYISIDLFSCKQYDFDKVLKFTKKYMKLRKMNWIVIHRQTRDEAQLLRGTL